MQIGGERNAGTVPSVSRTLIVLPTYQERATRAMQDRYIPLGMKELVKEYFSSLQPDGTRR